MTNFLSIYKNIVRLLAWHIKFKKCKALEKELNEELMPIALHPCQKMRKKKLNLFYYFN